VAAMPKDERFFWLHIKKSAGTSLREYLAPHYVVADRSHWPECFTQVENKYYNDLLNNYRIPLGRYQFSRALFAKKFLYPNNWDDLVSFAISREPVSRAVSMFYYLYWQKSRYELGSLVKTSLTHKKLMLNKRYAFDHFLQLVEASQEASPFSGMGLHFNTHVASMASDVTDEEGVCIIRHIYRLENVEQGVREVYARCGLDGGALGNMMKENKSNRASEYTLTAAQKRKIEMLYGRDFDIYETH